jgi:hypothetical protein
MKACLAEWGLTAGKPRRSSVGSQNRVPDFLHRPTRSAQPRVDCVAGNLLWIFVGVGQ